MYVVGCEVTLAGASLDANAVTDLIEVVVDELDRVVSEPSVSTSGTGGEVVMTVEVTVDEPDEVEALHAGFSAIRSALHAAEVGTPGMVVPSKVIPSVRRYLQSA